MCDLTSLLEPPAGDAPGSASIRRDVLALHVPILEGEARLVLYLIAHHWLTQIPPVRPRFQARAISTPSPKMSSPSMMMSPTLMPIRRVDPPVGAVPHCAQP